LKRAMTAWLVSFVRACASPSAARTIAFELMQTPSGRGVSTILTQALAILTGCQRPYLPAGGIRARKTGQTPTRGHARGHSGHFRAIFNPHLFDPDSPPGCFA
jgi:hypothetical protein